MRTTPAVRRSVALALAAAAVALACTVGLWLASGGRWMVVATPSMGEAAPVGTLLWVEPARFDSLRPGDFISFRAPIPGRPSYSHRVYAVHPNGALTTKGDINGTPDPWLLHRRDVTGKVALRWWVAGWVVRAAPALLVGGALLWVLARWFAAPRWRLPILVTGAAALVSIALIRLRPLVRAELIAFVPRADGSGALATVVSTGILPTRVTAAGGRHVDLRSGQVGSVLASLRDSHGYFSVHLHATLTLCWWLSLAAACFAPALISALAPRRDRAV